jgi:CubicO group peptidase (beta-lactamase class C family)
MRTSFLRPGLLLWAAATIAPAAAQPAPDPAIETKIQHIVNNIAPAVMIKGQPDSRVTLASRMAAQHVPGVSIAVIHDGKIAWARGFGVTRTGGAPVTPQTLFQAGSISKPVTAMAVLHLVQSGQLNLDADVNQYLKTWKVPENRFTEQKKVTLRELLTHTAGVTVHGFPGYASNETVPTLVQVLDGAKPANTPAIRVDAVPGTVWRYSGGGYVITQQLLLDATGKPFPDFMHDTVLGPLGMTHSTYEQPLPSARSADAATPYDRNGAPIAGGAHTYPEMAPAGLWTTPSDLTHYAIAIQQSLAGQSGGVLSKATAGEIVKLGGMGDWGLGLEVGGKPDHPYFEHGGADEGFISNLVAYDNGDGVAIMTNGDNGGALGNDILRTIALEYHWPDFAPAENAVTKVDPKLIDAYAGYYRQSRFLVLNLSRSGDHLAGKQETRDLGDLYPASDREWFFTNNPARLTFEVGSNGDVKGLQQHMDDTTLSASRISAAEASRIAEELAAKVKNQTQDPATEAALRRNIDDLREGKPDYGRMSPGLANVTRQQLSDLQNLIFGLGAVKSVTFKGVGPAGADMYDVAFEKGATQWRIIVGTDGKSESIGLQVLP